MKYNFPHKEGSIVTIYQDWENELDPIGTARLVSRQSLGRSFILRETLPEKSQKVYNYETWKVLPLDYYSPFETEIKRIRFLDAEGVANSAPDNNQDDMEDEIFSRLPIDSFIIVNGKEVF